MNNTQRVITAVALAASALGLGATAASAAADPLKSTLAPVGSLTEGGSPLSGVTSAVGGGALGGGALGPVGGVLGG